jgi:hypothetical protein
VFLQEAWLLAVDYFVRSADLSSVDDVLVSDPTGTVSWKLHFFVFFTSLVVGECHSSNAFLWNEEMMCSHC